MTTTPLSSAPGGRSWRRSTGALLSVGLALVFLLAAGSLLAMGGGLRALMARPLRAELDVAAFQLPGAVEFDPHDITTYLSENLQERARNDPALRVLLGTNVPARVADTVIPRLLSDDVIERMIEDSETLSTVIESRVYEHLVTGRVVNSGEAPLADVALTMPGVLHAETTDGETIEIRQREDRVGALLLGSVEPGQSLALRAWLGEWPDNFQPAVRLAAAGVQGSVHLDDLPDHLGKELELMPWAGRVVAGLISAMAVTSGVGLLMTLAWRLRRA